MKIPVLRNSDTSLAAWKFASIVVGGAAAIWIFLIELSYSWGIQNRIRRKLMEKSVTDQMERIRLLENTVNETKSFAQLKHIALELIEMKKADISDTLESASATIGMKF